MLSFEHALSVITTVYREYHRRRINSKRRKEGKKNEKKKFAIHVWYSTIILKREKKNDLIRFNTLFSKLFRDGIWLFIEIACVVTVTESVLTIFTFTQCGSLKYTHTHKHKHTMAHTHPFIYAREHIHFAESHVKCLFDEQVVSSAPNQSTV